MAPIFNKAFFLGSLSRSSGILQNLQNAKIFAYSLRKNSKKKIKKLLPKNKFKMAAKFKMATKTKFSYVTKKTLVCLKTFGQFDYALSYLAEPRRFLNF
jgi:hypothetical protein